MSNALIIGFEWTLTIGVCLFAWWRGGPAERWGSALNVFTSLCVALAMLMPHPARDMPMLIIDGVLALGLLILAVRYASLWIGAAMLLQAAQFSLHAYNFIMQPKHTLFAMVNNLVTVGILLCLFAGTLMSWRRRAAMAEAGAV